MTEILKLNIGSFTVMNPNDWINIDMLNLSDYAIQNGYKFQQLDIRKGVPYQNDSVDIISASHFLEHLDRAEGKRFLRDAFRTLKPNGIIRLTVPDAKIICQDYLSGNINRHASHNEGVKKAEDDTESLFHLLIAGHQTLYDLNSLSKLLKDTGFIDIEKKEYGKSKSKIVENENKDVFPEVSLYIEAIKPDNTGKEVDKGKEQVLIINDIPLSANGTINYGNVTTNRISTKDRLRIGLISTPFFQVPPNNYGGLEMVVWDLACGLDELGHEVTIFGPEGSKASPNGKLVIIGPSHDTVNVDWFELEKQNYEVYKNLIDEKKFDIIHGHTWFGFEYLLRINNPKLKTLHLHHGGFNWDSYPPIGKANLVAISDFMRRFTISYFANQGYKVGCEYVHNGIDLDKYPYKERKSNRLLFVGRLSTFKQPHVAIEVARKSGQKLDIIGGSKFVDSTDYVKQIENMVEKDFNITLYKDASHELKIEKMQSAKAIIIPSKMNEPMNLVSIEGQACGTPIICYRDGGLPETVIDGKTGFVCDTIEQMVEAVGKVHKIKPEDCRKSIEDNFSRLVMAKEFEKLYRDILLEREW